MPNNQAHDPRVATAGERVAQAVGLSVAAVASVPSSIPAYYIPSVLKFIHWDAPTVAHTGVDIDYKLTGYDWENRTLTWSVASGPVGMTIDADGTLHWTPSVEGSESVTVSLSLGGEETLTKTFTIVVDNSRCIFLATDGDDTTGDGTIGSPWATIEKAATEALNFASTGRVVYHRGGTYTKNPMNYGGTLESKGWSLDDPLIIRNYPGEFVQYHLLSGAGWTFFAGGVVVYGMDVRGAGSIGTQANTNEYGGVYLFSRSVAKRMKVYEYDCADSGNCTGFQHRAQSLLDQCEAWDNFDRSNPSPSTNDSNYLAYSSGDAAANDMYVIDCLSDSLGSKKTGIGFKIKHPGVNPPRYHKCVDTGTKEAFSALNEGKSVRFCTFFSDEKYAASFGQTDEFFGGTNYADNGFLVEGCTLIAGPNSGSALDISWYAGSLTGTNPPYFENNNLVSFNSNAGNIFVLGEFSSEEVPAGWDVGFNNNQIYTPSAGNAVVVKEVSSDLATLTSKGTGNTVLGTAPEYTFSAAGRTFNMVNGVVTEVL